MEYVGVEVADGNASFVSRCVNNIYFYGRDFRQQKSWMNLEQVSQVGYSQRQSVWAEGLLAFSPLKKGGTYLK